MKYSLPILLPIWTLLFIPVAFKAEGASSVSYRSPAEVVGHKGLEFEMAASFFSTTGHFDDKGNKVPLRGEESFSKLDAEGTLKYGMTRNLEFRLDLRGRKNASFVDDPSKGKVDLQADGLESYGAGFKYSFERDHRRQWNVALDLFFRQSAFQNEDYHADEPYRRLELGDEAREVGVGLHLAQRFKPNPIITYSAIYNYRTNHFSSEILYKVEAAFKRPRWALFGGLEGIHSLKTDSYSDNPQAKPRLHTGSTYLFNSVNRSHLSPMGGFNFTLSPNWRVSLKYRRVLSGTSTDEGHEGLFLISYQKQGVSDTQTLVDSFKEYEIEASVVKVSPREIFIKIDKGLADDVQKGMTMDIYQFDYLGGNILVGRGTIYEVEAGHSILKLNRKFQNIPIKVGFVVRGKYSE